MWKKVTTIGRQSPETHPCRSDLASFSISSSWMAGGCQLISQLLGSGVGQCNPLTLVCSQSWRKRAEEKRRNWFSERGHAENWTQMCSWDRVWKKHSTCGEKMSVAYSGGAMQFELEQVLLMLINCIAVFHHSLPCLLLPLSSAQLSPKADMRVVL